MYVYTHVDVPKCINTRIGMAPFTQTCGLCEWEAHRGVFSGGLGVVVPSTVALAPLFTTDQNCLRKAVSHSELWKQTQVQSNGIWGCAHRDLRRWPRQEDGKSALSGSDWLREPVEANSSSLGDPGKPGLISRGLAP